MIWRITHETSRGDILIFDKLKAEPLTTLIALVQTIFQDVVKTSFQAWGKVFEFSDTIQSTQLVIRNYIIIVLAASILAVVFLVCLHNPKSKKIIRDRGDQRCWVQQGLAIGGFALLVAGIPFWTTYLPVSLSFPRDRFTLSFMVGTSILIFSLIEAIPKVFRLQSILIVGLAVGLASGMHYQTALKFYREWQEQKRFLWQLSWRAPGIQPHTTIFNY